MRYIKCGRTDLTVSEIGLGCQSLGGGLYYRNDRESIATVLEAVDSGINFFDVSDHYTLGVAERLLGRAFNGIRDRVVIATKAGFRYAPYTRLALQVRGAVRPVSGVLKSLKHPLHKVRRARGRYTFTADYLTRAVERSLRRLQTDYLDLFQLYKPSSEVLERGDVYEPLEKMKTEGKIRHYGVACLTIEDAMVALRHEGNASVQLAINLLDFEGVKTLLAAALRNDVAVIGRNPRAIGLLTNRHDDLMGDSSAYDKQYAQRVRKAHELRFLIRENRTLAQAAIQFVLGLQGVTATLPRAVNRDELRVNLGSLTAPPLSQEELAKALAITAGEATP